MRTNQVHLAVEVGPLEVLVAAAIAVGALARLDLVAAPGVAVLD